MATLCYLPLTIIFNEWLTLNAVIVPIIKRCAYSGFFISVISTNNYLFVFLFVGVMVILNIRVSKIFPVLQVRILRLRSRILSQRGSLGKTLLRVVAREKENQGNGSVLQTLILR